MLFEEQVAELLRRCEKLVGKELSQIRGDLKSAQTRGAAVWELLVIEASSHMGALQHEPRKNGTLDIQVTRPDGRTIWVEATYLKPRFLEQERRSDAVKTWFFQEASRREIPLAKISIHFNGRTTLAGTARNLPELNERQQFLKDEEVQSFFKAIESQPKDCHTCALSRYTVSVTYIPTAQGPWLSSSGLAMESSKSVKQHALYMKLKKKAGQVSLEEPVIVCVGGDSSPALSQIRAPGSSSIKDAVAAAFRECSSLSAVVLVSIGIAIGSLERQATVQVWVNNSTKYPLSDEEIELLNQMNFNRWNYTYPFANWDQSGTDPPMAGTLTTKVSAMEIEIEIPASILIEFLAGRTCLSKSYKWEDPYMSRALEEGWSIAACSLKNGNVEFAQAPKIVLKLVSPSRVFGVKRDA